MPRGTSLPEGRLAACTARQGVDLGTWSCKDLRRANETLLTRHLDTFLPAISLAASSFFFFSFFFSSFLPRLDNRRRLEFARDECVINTSTAKRVPGNRRLTFALKSMQTSVTNCNGNRESLRNWRKSEWNLQWWTTLVQKYQNIEFEVWKSQINTESTKCAWNLR